MVTKTKTKKKRDLFEKKLAMAVQKSANTKLSHDESVSTTYAGIRNSCPDSCTLKKTDTCYVTAGYYTGMINNRLELYHATPREVAREEAAAIDGLRAKGQALRIHTGGDCKTNDAARYVSAAAVRFRRRGGGPVWSYTHAWRDVRRDSWRNVSVLASVEDKRDIPAARARGYAVAIVAPFPEDRKAWVENGTRFIPCPAQVRDTVACTDCKLCWDDQALIRRNAAIVFDPHGGKAKQLKAKLVQINARGA
jgi:hypothetical protein